MLERFPVYTVSLHVVITFHYPGNSVGGAYANSRAVASHYALFMLLIISLCVARSLFVSLNGGMPIQRVSILFRDHLFFDS